jgi:simple sugar transport system ATP-binding protein
VVRQIAASGRSVVFITHKMREVSEIADRVTVMRRGRVVSSSGVHGQSDEEVTRVIFGGDTGRRLIVPPADAAKHDEVIRFAGICLSEGGTETLKATDLSVNAGEIVCVAGIREYGPRQLEAICAGEMTPTSGSIELDGMRYEALNPSILRRHGVGIVPNDRYGTAISLASTVWESLIVARRREFYRHGMIDRGRVREFVTELLESAGIEGPAHRRVSELSGGTIQRLILAREIDCTRRVLIISEPFWGLDVEGRSRIVARLEALRRRGVGILVFASDIDDVLAVADRVEVFYRGAIVSSADRASISRGSIGNHMLGLGAQA